MQLLIHPIDRWQIVSQEHCTSIRKQHRDTWNALAARLEANRRVKIRDISTLLSKCNDSHAYRFAVHAYKKRIDEALGPQPDIKQLARLPLYSVYNAPSLVGSSMPIYANTPINQAYVDEAWQRHNHHGKKLLICATGRTNTLNMPLPIFHAHALRHFNAIVYLFDTRKTHYQECAESTIKCVESLLSLLKPGVLGFLGTSAGACMAIDLSIRHKNSKVVASSPIFKKYPHIKEHLQSIPRSRLNQTLRITYGDNPIDSHDKDYFLSLNTHNQPLIAYNMSFISPAHASLGVTLLNDMFHELLSWLASTARP